MKVVRLSALHTGRLYPPPRKYSWYTFLLEAESTPGAKCSQKDYVNEKFQLHHQESNPWPSGLRRNASTNCTTMCPFNINDVLLKLGRGGHVKTQLNFTKFIMLTTRFSRCGPSQNHWEDYM